MFPQLELLFMSVRRCAYCYYVLMQAHIFQHGGACLCLAVYVREWLLQMTIAQMVNTSACALTVRCRRRASILLRTCMQAALFWGGPVQLSRRIIKMQSNVHERIFEYVYLSTVLERCRRLLRCWCVMDNGGGWRWRCSCCDLRGAQWI